MTTIRTDAHRPSVIDPLAYDFVGFQYLRVDGLEDAMFLQEERRRINAHKARTGGERSMHEHGGNCDVCGSAFAVYKALFWHRDSNTYISTGLDCAEKMECGTVESFRANMRRALDNKAGKRKAQAMLEQANLSAAWTLYEQGQKSATELPRELPREETTLCDIVNRLVQYGSVSDGQISYLRRLVDQIANRAVIAAQRAAEAEKAAPVPVVAKRMTVRGRILSIKVPDYDRGECGPVRMLVQHATGWKVWGSLPKDLQSVQRGAEVEFDAAVKPSDRDTKFGFFSRPTKAREITETA
jgi:hypothetical protein